MQAEWRQWDIGRQKLNLTIEPARFYTGDVMRLLDVTLQHELSSEIDHQYHTEMYTLSDIEPLFIANMSRTNATQGALVLSPVAAFTAKAVGIPLLEHGFKIFTGHHADKITGTLSTFSRKKNLELPEGARMAGLTSITNKFSLIIEFQPLESYDRSSTSIQDNTILLKNLAISNEEFKDFLATQAESYMMNLAISNIPYTVDSTLPVIVQIQPRSSFTKYTFHFACIVP